MVSERLRSTAVGLLVSQCHLNEDQSLYMSAESYLDSISIINGELNRWTHDSEGVKSWFLDAKKTIKKIFNAYEKKVVETGKELLERK